MAPNPRTFGLPEDAHELVEQRAEHPVGNITVALD